ncbi:magnesium/cobalt transporter CorA [Herbaspirillum huttiense]|jgi:magnesium transporter|uniref:Magnesium transport protein CorA n=1 Tax=Herbaspirillum huttiense subsp. lycopersici TaxID=3074428 RepID=A0ABU2ENT4_9BURK|nr:MULTISPECIES: magnesium/cobalt transporter CorA [Herbaspirillum]MBW9333529.1 magnesium/cobalt transporter CorA [Herbaspirillum sp. RU 5E]BEV13591.1 magnesium/cobalt transporter CorA [Herbaspirillum sp. DW155]MAF02933.1 magnesium and cobalt transport protein CorA [Herbaspirillum sp.]MBN9354977.1 magnesium/cobalt transporter CorA [Herbaspirillum huttiense]MBO18641.1 magnesium and cobalt transport protein CorA [Herbaspirillum sp.]|tara:strand:- start:5898 stop:6863 length:966 start_codon:yes stop_codon:yes gene_type:complete
MINVFVLQNGRLSQVNIDSRTDLEQAAPVWVDLTEPNDEERAWVKSIYGVTLPDEDEFSDIEASARYFEAENGDLHLRTDFLFEGDDDSSSTMTVAFILARNILFSVHAEDLPVFRLVRMRARSRPGSIGDYRDVLLDLYETDAEYSADALEGIYQKLEAVSTSVLKKSLSDQAAAEVLNTIAHEEDLNGRIRRNMMDTRRAVSFLMRGRLLSSEQFEDARQILRDIESLDGHTAFLFDKINFLMDATVGFININQNKIIKIFSVASVAFLPPTLIASIYGMNFKVMPELDWVVGYPLAILMMVGSAIAPFWYFRRRGWLN